MHDTVSIRTATRWSSSDGGSAARATSGRALSIALVAAAMLALPGCRSTSTYYLPTAGQPRLNQDEFRDASDQILSVECPRLMGTSDYATGEARARIYLDRSGAVQKMEFTRPSNDERMNTVWGGLGARLQFDPQEGQTDDLRASMITIGYSCGKGTALTTLKI
ncbi:MAG TPA: hypothetical protein VFN39_10080 [Gemmatimonadaceae bacterium]|nr:hypothetical protein [Gemmatimonadaceae bacterium]